MIGTAPVNPPFWRKSSIFVPENHSIRDKLGFRDIDDMNNSVFTVNFGWRKGLVALSPVVLFLCLYLAVSVIIGDFYKMPVSVALAAASVWSVVIYRGKPLTERIEVYSRAAANPDIMYMIWVFVLAGAFASLAKGIGSVDATVQAVVGLLPTRFLVPGVFVASCLISMAVGTSVGTVVALTPLAVEMANSAHGSVAFFVAVVLSGAFFGDNLSFISDTTIAATRTQGCGMKAKFRANILIVLPAALITLAIYLFFSDGCYVHPSGHVAFDGLLILPYMLVIALALLGVNVTVVLATGIIVTMVIGMWRGMWVMDAVQLLGEGIDSMGNLVVITLMAAGMLGVVKALGGIDFVLGCLTRHVHGSRGAQASIAALTAIVNLCTANNTVAIITVGSVSREICSRYGVAPRKAASLLDTASCITQCLIPYGAQTLLATALAGISPAAPWPYLIYPWMLAVMVMISIIVRRKKL